MEEIQQQEYWQKFDEAFFNDGYRLADMHLLIGFSKENLFAAQKQLYKITDDLIDSFLKRSSTEGKPSECRKGCSFCCHQTVLAAPYELLYLADYIEKRMDKRIAETVIQRASEKSARTSKLRMNKLLKHKEPCPLLHPEAGYCRAYMARPMACRIYLSSNVQSCKDDLDNPNNDSIYPMLFDMPLRAGRMLNEGFHARLRKDRLTSLQAFENTIDEGLLKAIEPKAFENWLDGKKVFRKIER
jgi:Fe-S-cluster containining protein